jgi:endonuclease/exonuclease/phosphatase family metal-dependent hydrolase
MQLKILTYNVLDGGAGREALILQVLQHARPDVVILEEVYEAPFVEQLGQVLSMQPFFGEGNRRRRVALLSRVPVEKFQSHHPNPPIWRNFVEAELRYQPGKRLRVFGVHPMAGLEVLAQEAWRWWEARTILRQVHHSMDQPCLIGGDFNAISPRDWADVGRMPRWVRLAILLQGNHIYRMSMRAYLGAGFVDCFRRLNPQAAGFTYPVPQPYAPLDHLLVNAALVPAVRRCAVLTEPQAAQLASDHYPLMLELELD